MKVLTDRSGQRVTVRELANSLGLSHHSDGEIVGIVREAGLDVSGAVADNWCNRASLPVEVAAEAFEAVFNRYQASGEKHIAYRNYLEERREAAQRQRDEAAAKRREQERREQQRRAKISAERAAQAERESLERYQAAEAERLKKVGSPVSYGDFEIPNDAS